ncbi:hypothetical protein [Stygiolobus sp. RP850M]
MKKGFKVRETEYYYVTRKEGNTWSPSPNIQQIGYSSYGTLT